MTDSPKSRPPRLIAELAIHDTASIILDNSTDAIIGLVREIFPKAEIRRPDASLETFPADRLAREILKAVACGADQGSVYNALGALGLASSADKIRDAVKRACDEQRALRPTPAGEPAETAEPAETPVEAAAA